jgi:hypothetical protein
MRICSPVPVLAWSRLRQSSASSRALPIACALRGKPATRARQITVKARVIPKTCWLPWAARCGLGRCQGTMDGVSGINTAISGRVVTRSRPRAASLISGQEISPLLRRFVACPLTNPVAAGAYGLARRSAGNGARLQLGCVDAGASTQVSTGGSVPLTNGPSPFSVTAGAAFGRIGRGPGGRYAGEFSTDPCRSVWIGAADLRGGDPDRGGGQSKERDRRGGIARPK